MSNTNPSRFLITRQTAVWSDENSNLTTVKVLARHNAIQEGVGSKKELIGLEGNLSMGSGKERWRFKKKQKKQKKSNKMIIMMRVMITNTNEKKKC